MLSPELKKKWRHFSIINTQTYLKYYMKNIKYTFQMQVNVRNLSKILLIRAVNRTKILWLISWFLMIGQDFLLLMTHK